MPDFLRQLFSSGDFMPHGYCYMWDPGLVWLHVVSDSFITLAYYVIPLVLLWFVHKRRDIPFNWMFICFGVFIVACGTTHLMEVWNLWHADYWLSGVIKAITAVASIGTAILLIQLMPQAVELPSPQQMQKVIDQLHQQAELLDLAHDAILERDLDGAIVYWNRGAERLYGWPSEQALNRKINHVLACEYPQPLSEIEAAVLKSGSWEGEIIHHCRDGSSVTVASRWSLRHHTNGQPASILEVNRDITERRNAEAMRARHASELARTNSELAAANQELESFSYSVSHDLRAPLRHIDGFSRILLDEHSSRLDTDGQHYLQRIADGAKQMGHLVDDLLNLSRLGRQELNRQSTNLSAIVENARIDLAESAAGRAVEWKIAPLPAVDCDPSLMKVVFSNLLSNALKFTTPRQQAVIELGCTEEEEQAFFVRDNGVGFDAKYADKLFGVFQRLHCQEDFEGTGVGLATVQRIIHKHGGRIWAESAPDRGATFYFTLQEKSKLLHEVGTEKRGEA